ncbi:MAG: hypothetical protein RLZ50_858 [Bacteroidota bacterium]|jgi:hypothetical protein
MEQNLNIIIKKIALAAILITISPKVSTQTLNNGIFFQAVARDNFSNPAMNRKIYVQSSIIQNTATGTKVLTEEFQTTTDATGVFSISVGQGLRIGGTVSNLTGIDWAKGPYFLSLKIAITPIAPTTTWDYKSEWIDLGTTSFGAVPYALYAGTAAGLNDKLNITDTSGMLALYAKANTIKILEAIIGSKIASTDTAAMLAPYKKMVNEIIASNITSLTAEAINTALNSKVSLVDSNKKYVTPTQLAAKTFDVSPINSSIATKLNIADSINKYVTPTQLAAKTFDISPINISIASKVDKIVGKELSSNDYTNSEKIKLAEITGINTGDQDLSSYATNSNLNLKINITDTSTMLSNRIKRDTASLNYRINLKLNITDTALMLSNRIKRDTASLSDRINLKANISDLVTDLALKANTTDLIAGLDLKVDKQTGKILSTNDYTNTEKAKLAAISGSNTGDQDLSSYATNANLNLKINIADTSAMLSNRINRDTTALSNRINLKLDISDTALMLSNRIHRDTSSLSNRINLKANSSDIITDLALKANTSDVTSNLNLKINISDTSLMLSNRIRRDTASLSNRINLKANSSDVITDLALKANTTDLIAGLDLKIDKQTGKILSTNDYTNTEKAKLAAISGNNTGDQDLSSYATHSNLGFKLNILDTAEMLNNRIKRDTNSLSNRINNKLNIVDTNAMLNNRFNRDTASLSDRINLKANSSDIITDLALKANTTDLIAGLDLKVDKQTGKILSSNDYTITEKAKLAAISGNNTGDQDLSSYATNANLNLKINIADTSTMLSDRIKRDTAALSNRINLKANTTDVVNELALKQAIIPSGTTSQFYRGDKTWQTISYSSIGAAPTAGANSITTLGTITSGTWNGTTIAVANGGTGATSLTASGVLIGNATNAVTTVAPSTNGNVLTSNGTNWISSTPSVSLIREVANEFYATTSQTSFTLTQTPSVNSKVKMYINGVRISNSAYSITGTTLTYNATNNGAYSLTASDRIQFDYYY